LPDKKRKAEKKNRRTGISQSRVSRFHHPKVTTSISLPVPFLYLLFLAIIILLFIYQTIQNNHIQDDAFISFRYVKNFIEGNGLVFNTGEHVEGYTSLLWILLLSIFGVFKINIVEISQYLSVIFGILTIIIIYLFSLRLNQYLFNKSRENIYSANSLFLYSLIPPFLLSITGAFRYWAVSGMETTFYLFILLSGIYLYIIELTENKNTHKSFYLFAAALLIRPEALIIVSLTFLHQFFLHIKSIRNDPASKRKIIPEGLLIPLIIISGLIIALTVFRYFYYGYPLPNTFYAKTGLSLVYFFAGLEYIFDFLKTYMVYGILIILPVLLIKQLKQVSIYLLSIILFYTLYVILIGGDVLPLFRFLLPLLPLIYALFLSTILFLLAFLVEGKLLKTIILVLITLLYSYYIYFPHIDKINEYEKREILLTGKMKDLGEWLAGKQKNSEEKISAAATTIGALSYYSDVRVIDMLGLTDEFIAHNPEPIKEISGNEVGWKERNYNVNYILSSEPDYIIFSTEAKPSAFAERALFTSDEFLQNYYPYYVPADENILVLYKRKPDKFITNGSYNISDWDYSFISLYSETLSLNNNNDIIKNCYKLIKVSPPFFSPPYHLLAQILEVRGDTENALKNYRKALEIDEFNFVARMKIAGYHNMNNNREEMYYHLNKIKEFFPDYYSYMILLDKTLQD